MMKTHYEIITPTTTLVTDDLAIMLYYRDNGAQITHVLTEGN